MTKKIEDMAVPHVIDYERRHGREAADRRGDHSYPADIESHGADGTRRDIELKATGTHLQTGLSMQQAQIVEAKVNPDFHLYVVEHLGADDPSPVTLRVVAGQDLRDMVDRAIPRTSYEIPWPKADYDATLSEELPDA